MTSSYLLRKEGIAKSASSEPIERKLTLSAHMTGWSVRGNNNITMVLESVRGNNINIVLEYVRGNNMVLKRELLCSLKLEIRTLS